MRKLLAIMPVMPYPPHQGTNIRNYNLLRHLTDEYTVHLLTFYESSELVVPEPLKKICSVVEAVPAPVHSLFRRFIRLLSSPLPDVVYRKASSQLLERLKELTARYHYDIVHVEGIEVAQYGLWLARRRNNRKPALVFGDQNAEYLLQKRAFETDLRYPRYWGAAFYSLLQWGKLARYEAKVCRTFDRVIAVSEADKDALMKLVPGLEVRVVSNGVDVEFYANFTPHGPPSGEWNPYTLVFTGKMDFRPNVDAVLWFAREILPKVKEQFPQARFYVVGRNPHPRLKALMGREDVVITGYVEDIRPYLAFASVFVVPMRMGGGTRLKILEAMAMKKAVVSTTLGAEGYPFKHELHLLLANDPQSFAEAICRLLRDEGERARLGEEAFKLVNEKYRWEKIIKALKETYRELLES
ncbi:MAG: glycosyltransferase [Anaerolineae bacterium]|nr:glycosyltransferase [Anaerolineae bacterium]MDW8102837.1 glycosyltransferase [Anaerolineae bacterium]